MKAEEFLSEQGIDISLGILELFPNSLVELLNMYANQSRWISVKEILPTPFQNVLAICNGKVEIMALTEIRENGEVFKVWSMVYDGLNGDAFYDEDYGVSHWQPIPKP